jgi:hypothetical protein
LLWAFQAELKSKQNICQGRKDGYLKELALTPGSIKKHNIQAFLKGFSRPLVP